MNKYIQEYLQRNNYTNTATAFDQESKLDMNSMTQDISSMGFLFEWWCLLWDINGNRLNKTTVEPSSFVDVCGFYICIFTILPNSSPD